MKSVLFANLCVRKPMVNGKLNRGISKWYNFGTRQATSTGKCCLGKRSWNISGYGEIFYFWNISDFEKKIAKIKKNRFPSVFLTNLKPGVGYWRLVGESAGVRQSASGCHQTQNHFTHIYSRVRFDSSSSPFQTAYLPVNYSPVTRLSRKLWSLNLSIVLVRCCIEWLSPDCRFI